MNNHRLEYIDSNIEGQVILSGSKSISNRVLLIRKLTGNSFNIENLSSSDDTTRLSLLLNMICQCGDSNIPMVIDTGNAGTVARFLTAFLSFREGTWLVTGSSRMVKRPVVGLVKGLVALGADITHVAKEDKMPLRIVGKDIRGGEIMLDASESSQYVTALMLISPYFENGLTINFTKAPVSWPYIQMTQSVMRKFGVETELSKQRVKILPAKYKAVNCSIEGDWSSAAYWYQSLALADEGRIIIKNLDVNSIQGDNALIDIYKKFGVVTNEIEGGIELVKQGNVIKEFEYDFIGCPDLVPPVMATCAALGITSIFKNIEHLSYKESDRIHALSTELGKIGASLEKKEIGWVLKPEKIKMVLPIVFNTYDDHRIAMSLAPLVLKYKNIEIKNPEVVNKSYTNFWNDFKNFKFATVSSKSVN